MGVVLGDFDDILKLFDRAGLEVCYYKLGSNTSVMLTGLGAGGSALTNLAIVSMRAMAATQAAAAS